MVSLLTSTHKWRGKPENLALHSCTNYYRLMVQNVTGSLFRGMSATLNFSRGEEPVSSGGQPENVLTNLNLSLILLDALGNTGYRNTFLEISSIFRTVSSFSYAFFQL
jgi:hypothetical protein